MHPFAFIMAPHTRDWLYSIAKILYIAFIVGSFVYVSVHTARQVRAGRFFARETAPLPLTMQPPAMGWLFVICVLGLIPLQSILFPAIVFLGISAALVQNCRTGEVQFGFDRLHVRKAVTIGLLVLGAVVLVEAPLSEASAEMLDFFRVPHPEQQSVQSFRAFDNAGSIAFFLFLAVVFNPFVEELFFRGFLQTWLKNYTPTSAAIILSSGIFAFAHLNIGVALPLWFLGIALGLAYEHTGSLLVPVVTHACFNLATGLSLLLERSMP
jgi:membrane protease YdiL (CAAX protease family)